MSKYLSSLFLAIRPKTLVAAMVPVFVGHCLVLSLGLQPFWWITLCALGGALSIQIATNLLNDVIDFKKGADDEHRIGPRRVSQSGDMDGKVVMGLAIFFLVLAFLFGAPLVWRGGLPIVALGLISLFLAYGYTGGPFPLAYLGLGDLFVVLFFGLFAVGGTFYLQTLALTPGALIAGLQVGALATILLAINNLRDSSTDRKANKRTLAVRWGDSFVKAEIGFLLVLIFSLNFYYLNRPMIFITFSLLPLAALIAFKVYNEKEKERLNPVLGLAAILQLTFGVLFSVALIL